MPKVGVRFALVGGFSPIYSLQCKKLFYMLLACLKLAQIACVSLITSYLRCVADACQHPTRPTGQLYSEMLVYGQIA